jgi:thymidylate synthase
MSRGCEPGEFVHTLGDAHLYLNHLDQADEQLKRARRCRCRASSSRREVAALDDFRYEDFEVVDYQAHPHIKAQVAV